MTALFKKRFLADIQNEIKSTPVPNRNLEKEALNKFREILKDEKDVEIDIEDDAVLLRFLRAKKFNIQESVALVHRSRKWKIKNQDLLSIPFDECKATFDTLVLRALKQTDKHGRRVIYIQAKNWIPEEISLTHGIKACWYLVEELILSEETQNNGVVCIFDLGNLPLSKIAYFVSFFTFKQINRMITFYQGGYPIKVKGVYFTSSPMIVSTTFHAVKYLLKKKLRDRIIVDSTGPQILHDFLGKENLPDCLEGDIAFEDSIDRELIKAIYSKNKF